jgi:hypothetical protein
VIYEMMLDVAERLLARGFPLRFEYGPQAITREGFDRAVVFVRDHDADDQWGPPVGMQRNPPKVLTREQSTVALVYAQSSRPGAHRGDHERLCEQFVDAVTAELVHWSKEAKTSVTLTGGKYVNPAELEHEQYAGVIYALRFRVPRSVYALSYSDELESNPATAGAAPTGAAAIVQRQTRVRIAGREDEDPGIGCDNEQPEEPEEDP